MFTIGHCKIWNSFAHLILLHNETAWLHHIFIFHVQRFINVDSMMLQTNIHNSPTIFFLNSYPLKAISFLSLINLLGQQTIFISTNVWIFFAITRISLYLCTANHNNIFTNLILFLVLYDSFGFSLQWNNYLNFQFILQSLPERVAHWFRMKLDTYTVV